MKPDDTNPGGPIDATPGERDMRRIEQKIDRIWHAITEPYNEVVAIRPRVAVLEDGARATGHRVAVIEDELAKMKGRLMALEGKRTPPTRPEIPE